MEMSKEQIKQEQEDLLALFSPDQLKVLKNLGQKKKEKKQGEQIKKPENGRVFEAPKSDKI